MGDVRGCNGAAKVDMGTQLASVFVAGFCTCFVFCELLCVNSCITYVGCWWSSIGQLSRVWEENVSIITNICSS